MNQRIIDISRWPNEANLSTWGRIIGLSIVTMSKYVRTGRLRGDKQLNGIILVTKEDICRCFHIKSKAK